MVVILYFGQISTSDVKIRAVGLILQAASHFLTPFLAGMIGKRSPNEAENTPNR